MKIPDDAPQSDDEAKAKEILAQIFGQPDSGHEGHRHILIKPVAGVPDAVPANGAAAALEKLIAGRYTMLGIVFGPVNVNISFPTENTEKLLDFVHMLVSAWYRACERTPAAGAGHDDEPSEVGPVPPSGGVSAYG